MNRLLFPTPPPPAVLGARHYRWFALATAALTAYGSLIPLDFQPVGLDAALTRFTNPDLIDPGIAKARGDWVVSVGLYATLSFLVTGALAVDRPRRRAWEVAFLCAAGCALFGVFVEFLQVHFPPRTVSVNDLVVEAVGSFAGVAAWLAAGQQLTEWFRRLWKVRGLTNLARLALPGYAAALLVAMLMPFDVVVSTAELAEKLRNGRAVTLVPFAGLALGVVPFAVKTLTNGLCFAALGLLTSLALAGAPRRRTWGAALCLGVASSALVETAQFFVFSRSSDVTDVLTGTSGLLAGWGVGLWAEGGRSRPALSSPSRAAGAWAAAFLAWAGVLLLVEWHPLSAFTTDPKAFARETEELPEFGLRRMSAAPLVDYYWNDKYSALDQFAKKSLAFAPLGLLAALLPLRRHGVGVGLTVAGVALLLGATIEAGQYFHPGHHPSVTDLLLGVSGAGLGYAVTRHLRAALFAPAVPATSATA